MFVNQLRHNKDKLRLINSLIRNKKTPSIQNEISLRNYAIDTSKSLRDQPVKFSTSKAKSWDPIDTFISSKARTQPTSQPFIVIGSLLIFFVYFSFIREANELDEIFERPLEATIPNVKEMSLRHQISQYEQMGLDTRSLKEALEREAKTKMVKK